MWPLIAAALSFVAWQPWVRPDFDLWRADDGEAHLLKLYVFERAVRAGEWFPRWIPDLFLGFGYPVFSYYAPGVYYAGLLLRLIGLDVFTAVQVLGATAACAGAAGAYCLARATFGSRFGGLVAAVAYAYAPYPFITNLIIRADLPEAAALGLLPWLLLAAWRAGQSPTRGRVAALAAALAAATLTHNLTALFALPAAGALGVLAALGAGVVPNPRPSGSGLETPATPGSRRAGADNSDYRRARHALRGTGAVAGGLALALALGAFFWVPALVEQGAVHLELAVGEGTKAARNWLVDPLGATEQTRQPGNPQTVYGPLDLHLRYPYNLNFPQKMGLFQAALALLAAAVAAAGLACRRPGAGLAAGCCAAAALCWWATTTWSAWAWDHVPLLRFMQFAWRLNAPLALAVALAAAGATALLQAWGGARRGGGALALAPAALVLTLAASSTSARPVWRSDHVDRAVGAEQLLATENTLFGAGTTTGGEFVPRSVDFTSGPRQVRGNGTYERLYPELGWLAGRTWTLAGDLRISQVFVGPTWTDARVEAATPGTLAFRTVAFPGWRAYLDGRPVTPGTAPRDPTTGVSPGFLTIDVPAGSHDAQLAFGPTRTRSAAALVSVAALAWLGWWLTCPPGAPLTAFLRRRTLAAVAPAALLALAALHDGLRPRLGAPARPRPAEARLVRDLAAATRTAGPGVPGGADVVVASPSGPALGPFVNVQRLALAGHERTWLYMHPPSSVSITLELPPRAAFQAGLGLDPRTWDQAGADGVRFILEVAAGGAAPQRVLDEWVNPHERPDQRRWMDRWVDLSAFGGRRVTVTLRTDPAQSVDFDWAGWADPAIVLQRDARRPGGGPPGPVPTPRAS